MIRTALRTGLLVGLVVVSMAPARAQVATGMPRFGSFSGGPFDTVNNAALTFTSRSQSVLSQGAACLSTTS